MKKIFMTLVASVMMSLSASAFTFDGIDITGNVQNVMREIAAKGYVFNEEHNWLEGSCQGTVINLSFNLTDVKTAGKIGQMLINIPVEGGADAVAAAFKNAQTIFNVIYHADKAGTPNTYVADADGTTMQLTQTATGLRLTYNTPFYKKK